MTFSIITNLFTYIFYYCLIFILLLFDIIYLLLVELTEFWKEKSAYASNKCKLKAMVSENA